MLASAFFSATRTFRRVDNRLKMPMAYERGLDGRLQAARCCATGPSVA